jgi:hypothetical protein
MYESELLVKKNKIHESDVLLVKKKQQLLESSLTGGKQEGMRVLCSSREKQ